MKKADKIFLVIGSVALVGAASVGGVMLLGNGADSNQTSTSSEVSTSPESSQADRVSSQSALYKDGTYTASADYRVPEGHTNIIDVKLSIVDGKIATVSLTSQADDVESKEHIGDFVEAISGDAKGQSIADYQPSRVGGASLTTGAFNDVLDAVRDDARA